VKHKQPRRIAKELTPVQLAKLQLNRQQVQEELPELILRDQMRKEAGDEPTLSGELRRAIHASPTPLTEIATQVGISQLMLDEFLTGERTLRSDVLDRLAKSLSLQLVASE
jgi:hypothetical protein